MTYWPIGIRNPGVYEISVDTGRTVYVDITLNFYDESAPPLVAPLTWTGDDRFRRTVNVAMPVRSIDLVVTPSSPRAKPVDFRRVGLLTRLQLGWRKLQGNLATPGLLLKKLGYYLSGQANVAFSRESGHVDPRAAYRHWQAVMEKQSAVEAPQPGAVLAVWLPAAGTALLEAFIDWREAGEDGGVVALWVVEDAASPLPSRLRVRAESLGARFFAGPLSMADVVQAAVRAGALTMTFLEWPGVLAQRAAGVVSEHLGREESCLAVYGDSDQLDSTGERSSPFFKPQWSREYALSWNYVGGGCFFRCCTRLQEIAAETGAADSLSLLLALDDKAGGDVIHRLPSILFHERLTADVRDREQREKAVIRQWATAQPGVSEVEERATTSGAVLRRVCYALPENSPKVSVIIPSRDNPDRLAAALAAVRAADYERLEVIVVDNGSTGVNGQRMRELVAALPQGRVIRDDRPFNFSALINRGRSEASGEVLLLLNDDVALVEPGWLSEMVSLAVRPEVGCVGALLLYPDGRVQHAGVTLGIRGGVEHAFLGRSPDEPERGKRLQVRREVSAVTGACLAVRCGVFDEVGGFDESLAVTFNDIDFCLRVSSTGLKNLFTPHARLIHLESASRGLDISRNKIERAARERQQFLQRWQGSLEDDPFYSPHLDRYRASYTFRLLG